jgi:outer membrane protein OmpA-like peptidoglycan-associated protein
MSTGMSQPVSYNIDPTKTYKIKVMQEGGTTANVSYVDGFTSLYSTELTVTGSDSNTTTTTTPAITSTTTTIVPSTTTTTAPKSVTTTTTVPLATVGNYATAVPGVTVTDTKVYAAAPKKVSADSAIIVMTPTESKTYDIVSKTPSVCLPNDNDLVFINDGKCIATVVNEKTRAVLRTLKTTVVDTDISTLKVGNEVVVLSPLYFDAGSSVIQATSAKRLTQLLITIKKAGSILISGHSGNLMGNTPENRALSKMRAASVVTALKKLGATAPIAIAPVGALDPVSTGSSQADQDKNRRAIVVLIP